MADLTTWKGKSGQRYPALITPASEACVTSPRDCLVALAVQRTKVGSFSGLASRIGKPVERITRAWLSGARASGATEIHTIDPCADPQAVIADLSGMR